MVEQAKERGKITFQYISCYGLSRTALAKELEQNCFNTSHVTVYQAKADRRQSGRVVSIHLMLRFISQTTETESYMCGFNTSHVTVYLAASKKN